MRVAITGGAGFLGKYVIKAFVPHVEYIGIVDNLDPLCGGTVPVAPTDVRNYDALFEFVESRDITHILHLAAYGRNLTCQDHPYQAWDVNVTGTRNVLEVARRRKGMRVIVCSSNIVLSDQPTVYKTTKETVEQLTALYASLGVSCMGIRPSNIYGEGQSKTEYQMCAFAGLDESYRKCGVFKITGDGTQTRDWVHAADVAQAFLSYARISTLTGVTIDVATGVQTSMNDIAAMLKVPIKYVAKRPGDAKALYSKRWDDCKKQLKNHIFDAFPSVQGAS